MTEKGVVCGGSGAVGLRLWYILVSEQNPLFGSIVGFGFGFELVILDGKWEGAGRGGGAVTHEESL